MKLHTPSHVDALECICCVSHIATPATRGKVQYRTLRSVSDKHVHVICYEDRFYELPDHVRHQGPWQGMRRGDVVSLKAEYRLALARDGMHW
jgi:hypothetical protein